VIDVKPLLGLAVVAAAVGLHPLRVAVVERDVGRQGAMQIVLGQVQEGQVRLAVQVAEGGLEVQQAARTVVCLGLDAAVLRLLGLGAREEAVSDRLDPGIGRRIKVRSLEVVEAKVLDVVERVDGGGEAAQVATRGRRHQGRHVMLQVRRRRLERRGRQSYVRHDGRRRLEGLGLGVEDDEAAGGSVAVQLGEGEHHLLGAAPAAAAVVVAAVGHQAVLGGVGRAPLVSTNETAVVVWFGGGWLVGVVCVRVVVVRHFGRDIACGGGHLGISRRLGIKPVVSLIKLWGEKGKTGIIN